MLSVVFVPTEQVGVHGIVIKFNDDGGSSYSATFLPEVAAEQGGRTPRFTPSGSIQRHIVGCCALSLKFKPIKKTPRKSRAGSLIRRLKRVSVRAVAMCGTL